MNSISKFEYVVEEQEDDLGRLVKCIWRDAQSGKVHRIGRPAIEVFDAETGAVIAETWVNYREGGKHREGDLPAFTKRDPQTGIVIFEEYHRAGRLHRNDDQPAEIHRDGNTGQVTVVIYSEDGFRYRNKDKPAVQEFDPITGMLTREEFYHEGKLHRDRGPAILEYDTDGNIIPGSPQYYKNGRETRPRTGLRLDTP